MVIDDMRNVQGSLETKFFEQSREVEAEALAVIGSSPKYAVKLLTDFTCASAQEALAQWKAFGEKVIVKYNDFVIKDEKNGKVLRGKTGLAGRMTRPGYPAEYCEEIVRQTGDKYLMPESK